MREKEELQKLKLIDYSLNLIGIASTVAGLTNRVKKNPVLNRAMAFTGGVCSIASFITFMKSLEQYGVTEDIDEIEITEKILFNVVVLPVANTLLFADSIKK